jgi:hypothetical protein
MPRFHPREHADPAAIAPNSEKGRQPPSASRRSILVIVLAGSLTCTTCAMTRTDEAEIAEQRAAAVNVRRARQIEVASGFEKTALIGSIEIYGFQHVDFRDADSLWKLVLPSHAAPGYQRRIDELLDDYQPMIRRYRFILERVRTLAERHERVYYGSEDDEDEMPPKKELTATYDRMLEKMRERGVRDPERRAKDAFLTLHAPVGYMMAGIDAGLPLDRIEIIPLDSASLKDEQIQSIPDFDRFHRFLARESAPVVREWIRLDEDHLDADFEFDFSAIGTLLGQMRSDEAKKEAMEYVGYMMDMKAFNDLRNEYMARNIATVHDQNPTIPFVVGVGAAHVEGLEKLLDPAVADQEDIPTQPPDPRPGP